MTAVVMGEKVYVGGGNTQTLEDSQQQVFQYDPSKDEWNANVSEPHTRNANVSEPHTQNANVSA